MIPCRALTDDPVVSLAEAAAKPLHAVEQSADAKGPAYLNCIRSCRNEKVQWRGCVFSCAWTTRMANGTRTHTPDARSGKRALGNLVDI